MLNYSNAFDVKKLDPPNPSVYRKSYLVQFNQAFAGRVAAITALSKTWFVLVDSYLVPSIRFVGFGDQMIINLCLIIDYFI